MLGKKKKNVQGLEQADFRAIDANKSTLWSSLPGKPNLRPWEKQSLKKPKRFCFFFLCFKLFHSCQPLTLFTIWIQFLCVNKVFFFWNSSPIFYLVKVRGGQNANQPLERASPEDSSEHALQVATTDSRHWKRDKLLLQLVMQWTGLIYNLHKKKQPSIHPTIHCLSKVQILNMTAITTETDVFWR